MSAAAPEGAQHKRARHYSGGHFYPLDVRAALDLNRSGPYVARCVARALRQPDSARNRAGQRARASWERARREAEALREARTRTPRSVR